MIKGVWINGTFDVLTFAHFEMIKYARTFGGFLMMAVDSDQRVKFMKGIDRPYHNEKERVSNLMSVKGVGMVQIFNSDEELENMVNKFQPDVMIVGSDWEGKKIIGGEYAKEIKYFQRIQGYSSTEILNNGNTK